MFKEGAFYVGRTGRPAKFVGVSPSNKEVLVWEGYYLDKNGKYYEDKFLTTRNGVSIRYDPMTGEPVVGKMVTARMPKNTIEQDRIKELLLFLGKNDLVDLTVKLSKEVLARIEVQANLRNMTLSELISRALPQLATAWEENIKSEKIEQKPVPVAAVIVTKKETPAFAPLINKSIVVTKDAFRENIGTLGMRGSVLDSEFFSGRGGSKGTRYIVRLQDGSTRKFMPHEIKEVGVQNG